MTTANQRKRTRKAPEARRAEILDCAAWIVLEEGLSAVSMEQLAREGAISKALVYTYFSSRDDLLAALLQREQDELRKRGAGGAREATNFADLIRRTTRPHLEQVQSRGALIAALLSDPSVARLMEAENRVARERARRFFIRRAALAYGLQAEFAAPAVDLLWAVTDEAGRQLAKGGRSRSTKRTTSASNSSPADSTGFSAQSAPPVRAPTKPRPTPARTPSLRARPAKAARSASPAT